MDITIRMKQEYGQYVTFTTPFNDLFANVPFLSRIVDVGNLSSKYFNNSYGRIGTDQIMPLIGEWLNVLRICVFANILNYYVKSCILV